MAQFEPIVQWVLYQEDSHHTPGLIVALRDGAGLTRLGITSRNFATKVPADFFTSMAFGPAVAIAKKIYHDFFWVNVHGDQLPDAVAAPMFSFAVNKSPYTAIQILQKVLDTKQDGVLGSQTMGILNSKDPNIVATLYRAAWIDWYHNDVNLNPSKAGFLSGWVNRANFPYPSPEVPNIYA